eukprot:1325847-Amorphochlora_amoeboformis.AAC.1
MMLNRNALQAANAASGRRHSLPIIKLRSPMASPLSKLSFKLDESGRIALDRNPVEVTMLDDGLGSPRQQRGYKPKGSETGEKKKNTNKLPRVLAAADRDEKESDQKLPSYKLYDDQVIESSSKIQEKLEQDVYERAKANGDDEDEDSDITWFCCNKAKKSSSTKKSGNSGSALLNGGKGSPSFNTKTTTTLSRSSCCRS